MVIDDRMLLFIPWKGNDWYVYDGEYWVGDLMCVDDTYIFDTNSALSFPLEWMVQITKFMEILNDRRK